MNKRNIFYIVTILGIMIFTNACYYDKSELLYPTVPGITCDTTGEISYNQKVVPLLKTQCYSCHTATGGSGGINMSNYTNDKVIGLDGKLYGSIGYFAMPQGGNTMTACDQAIIKKWIDSGCLNN
jgi:hypothetical protein